MINTSYYYFSEQPYTGYDPALQAVMQRACMVGHPAFPAICEARERKLFGPVSN